MTAHAKDCAPCDAARAVVEALRDAYDPLANWDEVEVEGKSQTAYTTELISDVLHKYPVPGGTR